jgi:hypothetical protein
LASGHWKKNEKVSLNFLLVGHTRFSPDRVFGLIKHTYSRADIDTFREFVHLVVAASPPSGHSLAVPVFDSQSKKAFVQWKRWDVWLLKYFHKVPNITRYHHFTLEADKNYVSCQEFANTAAVKSDNIKINPPA